MKIAVISDIHENAHNLIQAIKMIDAEKCDAIFCLGDIMRSKFLKVIFTLKIPSYFVFGNHDGNLVANVRLFEKYEAVYPDHNNYLILELHKRKIFLTHYIELAQIAAKSGEFDACFGGHNHIRSQDVFGDTLCVNPGEITGTINGNPSFFIYDTKTNSGKFLEIDNPLLINTPEVLEFYAEMKKHK